MRIRITGEPGQAGGTAQVPGGLAGALLDFFRTPLRERFAGLGKKRAERRMELVEVLALGGRRQLMLVECDGRRYLIGAGSDSVQSIAEVEDRRTASVGATPLNSSSLGQGFFGRDASGTEMGLRH